jgi:hypothetical protein
VTGRMDLQWPTRQHDDAWQLGGRPVEHRMSKCPCTRSTYSATSSTRPMLIGYLWG